MAKVELYKKESTYTDKSGQERKSIQFYVQCGNSVVPIDVTYFNRKDAQGNSIKDSQYPGRREVMKSYADELPAK